MPVTISMEQFRKRFTVHPSQQTLGNGHFSKFFLATDGFLKTDVVLKTVEHGIDPRLRPTGCLKRRIQKIHHPNLLDLIEHLTVEAEPSANGEKGFELYVMEYHPSGDLDALYSKGMSMAEKVRIVDGLLNGLDALHQRRIVHGNLKPRNVIIQDVGHPHVRLADYGWVNSKFTRHVLLGFPEDSVAYFAPEQLGDGKVRYNADFWSLGMLVYEIFAGKYVFGDRFANTTDLISRIQSADFPKDIDQIPKPYSELVKACLVRDSSRRPRKVKTLRKILAGEIVWRNGQAEKIAAPVPQDIYCYNCGTANRPGSITCNNCGKALTGPEFLKNYRPNNVLAFWAILWFTMCLLPIGFFYYGLHKTVDPGTKEIRIGERVKEVVEFYNDYLKNADADQYDESDRERMAQQTLTVVLVAIGSYFLLFGFLWFIFHLRWAWRASNNLMALGSHKRVYHPSILIVAGFVIILGLLGIAIFPILAAIAIPVSAIIPLLILQEVWRGSNPAYLVEGIGWKSAKRSTLIASWWCLSIVFPVLLVLPLMPTTLDLAIQIEWFYLTIGILLAYYILFMLVFVRINYRQYSKYAAWARQGGVVSRRSVV